MDRNNQQLLHLKGVVNELQQEAEKLSYANEGERLREVLAKQRRAIDDLIKYVAEN